MADVHSTDVIESGNAHGFPDTTTKRPLDATHPKRTTVPVEMDLLELVFVHFPHWFDLLENMERPFVEKFLLWITDVDEDEELEILKKMTILRTLMTDETWYAVARQLTILSRQPDRERFLDTLVKTFKPAATKPKGEVVKVEKKEEPKEEEIAWWDKMIKRHREYFVRAMEHYKEKDHRLIIRRINEWYPKANRRNRNGPPTMLSSGELNSMATKQCLQWVMEKATYKLRLIDPMSAFIDSTISAPQTGHMARHCSPPSDDASECIELKPCSLSKSLSARYQEGESDDSDLPDESEIQEVARVDVATKHEIRIAKARARANREVSKILYMRIPYNGRDYRIKIINFVVHYNGKQYSCKLANGDIVSPRYVVENLIAPQFAHAL